MVTGSFPPPGSSLLPPADNQAGKDLRVLRYMSEGKVPLAPERCQPQQQWLPHLLPLRST
jgi:hypothetical protein